MRLEGKLWHHRDFLWFWTGDTITQFTGTISNFALPVVAVLVVEVSPLQLGILEALGFLAFPTLGLFVGVWIDRMKRKPVMIAANIIQVMALGSVPVAYVLGSLGVYQLYLVALVMGITTVFYDVAYQSYLPSLVAKEEVIEGNQKLQTSASASQVLGPTVASALIAIFGAALSVAADAVGTLIAVFTLGTIQKPEPEQSAREGHFFAEMKEGIKIVTGNKLLWTLAGCTGTSNFGTNIAGVAFILYLYRTLMISPGIAGIAFSIGAAGFLAGVFATKRITNRLGLGRTIAVSISGNFALLLVLLAQGNFAIIEIGAVNFIGAFGIPVYNINQVSLRQIITPNRLQGRMNATMRTIIWGTIPAGAILGGILSGEVGIVPTLVLGTLISGVAVLWILLGPVFKLSKQPESVNE